MAKAKYKKGPDGYFRTRTWDGTYNPDGTKHRVNLKSDKSSADLEKQVNVLKQKVQNREIVGTSDLFFLEYSRTWLKTYKGLRERSTYNMYSNIIERHFAVFSVIKLQDITRNHIQWLVNETSDRPRTCQQIVMTWKQIIRAAIRDKLLPGGSYEDFCADLELPKYKATEKRPLTKEEVKAIKKAAFTDRERCFVLLIYGCGLRREEAIALTPFDISIKRRELTINKALGFDGNNTYEKGPKTENGNRTIPMPSYLAKFLKAYILTLKGSNRLIPNLTGGDITLSGYRRMWESIIEKMNIAAGGNDELQVITGLTAHVFRHNYCTQLCYQIPKISTKKIAQLMGDSEKMVLDVYSHILEEKEAPKEAIEDAVGL